MPNVNGLKLTVTLFRPHDPGDKDDVFRSAALSGQLLGMAKRGGFVVLDRESDYCRVKAERLEAAGWGEPDPPHPSEALGLPEPAAGQAQEAAPSGDDFLVGDTEVPREEG